MLNQKNLQTMANSRLISPKIANHSQQTLGMAKTPSSSSIVTKKAGNRMQSAIGSSNSTPSSSTGAKIAIHAHKRRPGAMILDTAKKMRTSLLEETYVEEENEDPNLAAEKGKRIYDMIFDIHSILPNIKNLVSTMDATKKMVSTMDAKLTNVDNNVVNLEPFMNEISEKIAKKKTIQNETLKPSNIHWKPQFTIDFGFNIEGKFVEIKKYSGINAKRDVAELIWHHQEHNLWESPVYNGVSLKAEIQEYLSHTFEQLDEPSKVAYSVGEFLWHKDHFLKHYMTSIKPRGHIIHDESRDAVPDEEKQLFIDIMLYCGGFLLDKKKNGNGKFIGKEANNWLEWASNGRELLNARGKQDKRKKRESSTVTKMLPDNFVPIYLRTEEHWDELRKQQLEKENGNGTTPKSTNENEVLIEELQDRGDGELSNNEDQLPPEEDQLPPDHDAILNHLSASRTPSYATTGTRRSNRSTTSHNYLKANRDGFDV